MPDKDTRVRISDIAIRAGVSAGTVDRVIHNRGQVAKKTRDRVLEIIREMAYEPDILASTLASKKTYRFASLIPQAGTKSPFWALPAEGIKKGLEQVRHFGVTHEPFYFNYFDRDSFSRAGQQMIEYAPDGVILAPVYAGPAEGIASLCQEKNIPLVLINANLFNLDKLSFVGQDSFRSGMVAARLFDFSLKGVARILIVNFMSEKGTNMHLLSREEGFRQYFEAVYGRDKAGVAPTVVASGNGNPRTAADRKTIHLQTLNISGENPGNISGALKKHLADISGQKRPDGIFVTNSRVFLVADFLKKMNMQGIRLIGYDLLEANISHLQDQTIAFLISQKPVEQGYRSFMTLFESLVLKKNIPRYQYLPIDIITWENIDYYLNSIS